MCCVTFCPLSQDALMSSLRFCAQQPPCLCYYMLLLDLYVFSTFYGSLSLEALRNQCHVQESESMQRRCVERSEDRPKRLGLWRFMSFFSFFPVRILLWFVARVALSRLCFDSQPELKDLVDAAGNSYPIGIWVNDWATGHLTARVVQIVIKDRAYRARAWPTWWLHDVRWYSKSNIILQHDLQ